MYLLESFRAKTFLVADPDAGIRNDDNLLTYETYQPGDDRPPGTQLGDKKLVAQGTRLCVTEVRVMMTGSKSKTIFARATAADGAAALGWTSTRNLDGKFVNETVGGLSPRPGNGRFGPNAAWSGGEFLEQVELVEIVDNSLEIERIAVNTAGPYFEMTNAGRAAGITVTINSGFRSYPEQKLLWEGYSRRLPGFNKAAKLGFSKHQNAIAFGIAVAGTAGSPVYDWLVAHATSYGFLRTVGGEPWHWEYDPGRAARARRNGTFKAPGTSD